MANISSTSTTGEAISRPRMAPNLDLATALGAVGAFAVIGMAMYLGGAIDSFFNLPSILIVIVGTFLVTSISFSWDEVARSQTVMLRAAVYNIEEPDHAALQVIYLADYARKRGKLALQQIIEDFRHNHFLYRAVHMVIDGLPTEEVERILLRQTEATQLRHLRSAGVLRRAGEVAPAMGLIGTLVGLVQMLGRLDDPSTIGPSMAVALLTTFYGAVLANMVFTPLANKLERNSQIEASVNHIYAVGAASISRQENPRRLEMLLNTALPPHAKVSFFE